MDMEGIRGRSLRFVNNQKESIPARSLLLVIYVNGLSSVPNGVSVASTALSCLFDTPYIYPIYSPFRFFYLL